jgi:hypothetical protein
MINTDCIYAYDHVSICMHMQVNLTLNLTVLGVITFILILLQLYSIF